MDRLDQGKVALIGGSGMDNMEMFKDVQWQPYDTHYGGKHSIINYKEKDGVLFFSRHGGGDAGPMRDPDTSPYAQIMIAARMKGVNTIIGTSACGTYNDEKTPIESLVLPDSYVDLSSRKQCILDAGVVVHLNPRPAFSKELTDLMYEVGKANSQIFKKVCRGQTIVQIKGPPFSSAEETKYRKQFGDDVGMTSVTEGLLALNLGFRYQAAHVPVDGDSDAQHEKTGIVMGRMGQPDRLPAYLSEVIDAAKEFAKNAPPLKQLEGNLKVDWVTRGGKKVARLSELEGHPLREIAQVLIDVYWKE